MSKTLIILNDTPYGNERRAVTGYALPAVGDLPRVEERRRASEHHGGALPVDTVGRKGAGFLNYEAPMHRI